MKSTNYEMFDYFAYTADVNKICPQVTHLIMFKVFQVGLGNLRKQSIRIIAISHNYIILVYCMALMQLYAFLVHE
jgi:hypothetical protein